MTRDLLIPKLHKTIHIGLPGMNSGFLKVCCWLFLSQCSLMTSASNLSSLLGCTHIGLLLPSLKISSHYSDIFLFPSPVYQNCAMGILWHKSMAYQVFTCKHPWFTFHEGQVNGGTFSINFIPKLHDFLRHLLRIKHNLTAVKYTECVE